MMSYLLQLAEPYKPLALYSGTAIVLLGMAHAVRVIAQARSTSPTR